MSASYPWRLHLASKGAPFCIAVVLAILPSCLGEQESEFSAASLPDDAPCHEGISGPPQWQATRLDAQPVEVPAGVDAAKVGADFQADLAREPAWDRVGAVRQGGLRAKAEFDLFGTLLATERAVLAPLAKGDGAAGDHFGKSVAIFDQTAVIGVPSDSVATHQGQGSVYVFVREGTSWTLEAKLVAKDGETGDHFGASVAMFKDTIVIGTPDVKGTGGERQGAAYVFSRIGTSWEQQEKLQAYDGAALDQFGCSVSISGETLVVGTCADDVGTAVDRGSVYVYVYSLLGWALEAHLTASDGTAKDWFGGAVSIEKDVLLVGAYLDDAGLVDSNEGSAYVFRRSASLWTQEAKLVASDAAGGDYFGYSVSLSEETALVGAYGDDVGTFSNSGSAYAFVPVALVWSQQAKITSGNSGTDDNFGFSVSVAGDTASVGAPGKECGSIDNCGSAYIYVRVGSTWIKRSQHYPDNPSPNDSMGYAVAASPDTVLAGAYLKSVGLNVGQGVAMVFVPSSTNTTWVAQATLTSGEGASDEGFGSSVAISGDVALVGVPYDDGSSGQDQGAAYLFARAGSDWVYQTTLEAADGSAGDSFGYSVALSGDTAAIGAVHDDIGTNTGQGSVYVFVRSGDVWFQQAKLLASDGSAGDWMGSAVDLEGDTLVVTASHDTVAGLQGRGSAYVFVRSEGLWFEEAKLTASDGAAYDSFGFSVALDQETLAIGAPDKRIGALDAQGAVYVFVRSLGFWTEQARLLAADGAAADRLGASVAVEGDVLAAGAPFHSVGSWSDQGAAYVFVRGGGVWYEQAELAPSDAGDFQFGSSVTLSGSVAVVGASKGSSLEGNPGAAYLFERSGTLWFERQKLTSASMLGEAEFGASAAFGPGFVLVGAPAAPGPSPYGNPQEGRAVVYELFGLGVGQECSQDAQCALGFCVSGVCCQSGCQGPCQTGACDAAGSCEPVVCDDSNPCTDDICDVGTGACVYVANDTYACSDGNPCSLTDQCSGGACVGGNWRVCTDGNACTDDACDAVTGDCEYVADDSNGCTDGNACTQQDICQAAVCIGTLPVVCEDGNQCTDDYCNPATGLCVAVNDDTNPCTDLNACTLVDLCSSGVCLGTTPKVCDDGHSCTDDACNAVTGLCEYVNDDSNFCSDGNACTQTDHCSAGTCLGNNLKHCNDDNPCTDDACNTLSGVCEFFSDDTNSCSDGDACTQPDQCVAGVCLSGAPTVCDDGKPCTDETCDTLSGLCVYVNNDSNTCSDGNACTQTDYCEAGVCTGANLKECDDQHPCTDDACNSVTGLCQFFKDDSNLCSDGNACTLADQCQSGSCVGGPPMDCVDDNLCNGTETCNPATGCVAGQALVCDDGLPYTIDSCDPQVGCQFTPTGDCTSDADCDDGDVCTQDTCLASTWMCHYSQPMDCSDHNLCNGIETCDPEQGCTDGTALYCDDDNICTDDACDPVQGCLYVQNSAACHDSDECTVADTCSQGQCLPGTKRDCDDQNPCTLDTCIPLTGCNHASPVDTDEDGICDPLDLCPTVYDPEQLDMDEDGVGDLCDSDRDQDGWDNDQDNCPDIWNPQQEDEDGDGQGDACDTTQETSPEPIPDIESPDVVEETDLVEETATDLEGDTTSDLQTETTSDLMEETAGDVAEEVGPDQFDTTDTDTQVLDSADLATDSKDWVQEVQEVQGKDGEEIGEGDLGPITPIDAVADTIVGPDLGGEPIELVAGNGAPGGCSSSGDANGHAGPVWALAAMLLAALLWLGRRQVAERKRR